MKRVCVFCGSSPGKGTVYTEQAAALGKLLAERGIGLVYGGASVGTMGVVADAALAAGGEVIGVIPGHLMDAEVGHHGLTELHVVATMHERKAKMAELSDGFLALPGGAGTLEELFEVWTWAQLGLHAKPLGLVDVAGYFQPLRQFVDHMVDEGFLRPQHREMVSVDPDPRVLLEIFESHNGVAVNKWTGQTPN
ncbi:TIGR00730 family Rossman fold protein [Amycolatopsis albispora]|uniref:LOG family protein n=1 Tax=Amycolatopsis albispora TaxID=1804986 RepID=UPI000DE408DF|nr:TIGR00730 family Rossman fold protein [Amycolatopsis albispora]